MASRFLVPYSSSRSWMQDPLYQLQREIDRVFEDVFSGSASGSGGGRPGSMMNPPRIDLQDAEGELRLHADLPGVQPSDLDVRVDGDVLTIRGERKSENERNEQNFHVMERSHGRFQRSIQLPFAPNPDEVQASVREGVLEVRIPKRAPQERSRRIEVRGAESGGGGHSMTSAVSGGSGSGSQGAGGSGAGAQGGAGADTSRGKVGVDTAPGRSSSSGSSTGQGPGGTSSVTPGVGGQSGSGSSSGMAGVSGGPTEAPAGEASAKR